MSPTNLPLSSVLPPLVFGTATFNYQYTSDPFKLPTIDLVHKALSAGIRAFDTSPYYGPAEEILGKALIAPYLETTVPFPRPEYFIITKVGRIASSIFNYSAPWVYKSIQRSLLRMHTEYLDVVYCHDVEFVTPAEVLTAVAELRRIRDTEGTIHYIGISGYPIDVLTDLAELVLRETGEPLDCVMSYANYTLQNKRLKTRGVEKFKAAGVNVVLNASILGMGLLRKGGVPLGGMGDWHPAPYGLRKACLEASEYCDSRGERLEAVAIRWALETWLIDGASVGSKVDDRGDKRLGVSVMGVSNLLELEETVKVWRVLDGLDEGKEGNVESQWSIQRRDETRRIAERVWEIFGQWGDYEWASPGKDYVRVEQPEGEL